MHCLHKVIKPLSPLICCKRPAVVFLSVLFCLIIKNQTGFGQTQAVTYTNTGSNTWTAPCGVTSITVQAWGGGGAGGGSSSNSVKGGGGGAGGAYVSSVLTVIPGNTYNLNVGSGANGSTSAGSQGSGSWFNTSSILFAEGGKGGAAPNGGNVVGGIGSTSASIGTTKIAGANGNSGSSSIGGAGGAGANSGGAGGTARGSSGGNGNDGSQPGGGGGGAFVNSGTDRTGGAGGDGKIIITYTGMSNYCTPAFGNTEPITYVNFGGIANTTSNSTSSADYEGFCLTANVSTGGTYAIQVKGNTVGNYIDYVTVFIDWNQDGDFNDANESNHIGILNNTTGTDAQVLTANITVPAGASLGNTKMRVYKYWAGYGVYNASKFEDDACNNNTYGQAEDYVVQVSGNCQQATGATANGTASTLAVCAGTSVTLNQTGGVLGVGQQWKWYTGSCGGTLLNSNTNSDASYIFTPGAGTVTYYIRAEGGTCGTTGSCTSVTVTVNTAGTLTVSSGSKDFAACAGVNSGPYVSYTIGGGATGATFSGLPAGLSATKTGNVYTISGATNVPGVTPYTVTLTGNAPCTNPAPISGSVTVNQAPATFSYSSPTITYCTNALITSNNALTTGGTPTGYAVIGTPLPAGLSLDASGNIIGTPTIASAATNYTIRASNACGSKDAIVNITISGGNTVFDITPTGTQNVCTPFGGIIIGLNGSQIGVSYRLYLNGNPTGPVTAGTGAAFSFGNQTSGGIYTVRTTSGCITNMNGSLTINITTQPTTTFTYSNYNYCNQGVSGAASFSGSPLTGTFSSNPAGVIFTDNTTGLIDLVASTPGTYSITYTVAASGGCGIYTYTQPNNVVIGSTPQAYNVFGGGGYCSGGGGVEVGLDNSETGVNYQLYVNGSTLVTTIAGTGAALSFGNQTAAGTYTVVAVKSPCNVTMNGNAAVVINPSPSAISISASPTTFCRGTIVPLTATTGSPVITTGNVNPASGTISLAIPDNNATGVSSLLKVAGIPAGATITGVSINFRITHSNVGDLVINLKGPNGNVLNVTNRNGGAGNNFGSSTTNTTVNSSSTTSITTVVSANAPFNSIVYSPASAGGVTGATAVTNNISNAYSFSGLYGSTASSANGNWILSVRDNASGTSGTFNNWQIVISYATITNPTTVTWSSATDLFTDPGGITPYTAGSSLATVYANPSASVSYTATATNAYGCSTSAVTNLIVNASPTLSMEADYCGYPGVVRVTSNSDIPVNNWTWSNGGAGGSQYTSSIDVNIAGNYYVSALSIANGCPAKGVLSIAQELVTNGDFEQGNTGFTSDYTYHVDQPGLVPAGQGELYDDSGTNGYGVGTDGQNYHVYFFGVDHTLGNGSGNFMVVNGHGSLIIWKNVNVTVLPNTDYYFSAWGISVNDAGPFARLTFQVNGTQVGSIDTLASGVANNTNNGWSKFYGVWNSGSNTSADIYIVDNENAYGGNDFGLDDISFGTLSTFLNLTSATTTTAQSVCYNTAITDITYEVGGDGSKPAIDNLPSGLTTYWNGRNLIIRGTPTQSGTFNYKVHGTGCNTKTAKGKIIVYAPASAGTFAAGLVSACYGSNGQVALTGAAGSIVKWQSSADKTGWTDIANTDTLLNYTNIQSPLYYRAIAHDVNGCGTVDTSAAVKLAIPNYWTGINSKDWNTGSNWSDNNVVSFTTCNTVVIPAGTPNSPELTSTNTIVQNINIASGAHLKLNDKTLTISGAYSGMGTLTGSLSSGLVINGNAGTIHFTPNTYPGNTTNNYLDTLTVNGSSASVTIGDSLNIAAGSAGNYGTVTVTGGDLYANGNLVLKSDANGTARIGYSTGKIRDSVTIERYIPPLRAWRFLAIPFSSSTQTIRNAWQEGVNNYQLGLGTNLNPHPGFGTHITGDNISTKGYDLNTTVNSSMKVWDTNIGSWSLAEPWTINTNIASYPAYCLFVRGSRAVDLSQAVYATADPTVLRVKGVLNQTGLTATKGYTGGAGKVIFVGNPYASSINIYDLIHNHASGFDGDKFWIWDPKLSGVNNVGGYVSYSNTVIAPSSSPSYPDAASTRLIESGQAFMVQLSSGSTSASMQFKEADKVSTEANVFGFAKQTTTEPPVFPVIYTNLMLAGLNGLRLADGVGAGFDNKFSAAVDHDDAKKVWNVDENLALVRTDSTLSIEFRPMPVLTDTLFYRMYLIQGKPYTLQIFAQNQTMLPMRAWLADKYLNTQTEVNLSDTTLYSFTPNSDLNSYRNRFMLVFKRQFIATPIPVTKIVDQSDPNITGNANSTGTTAGSVNVYPNPVSTDKVALQFGNMDKGNYEVTVYSPKGQKLSSRKIEYSSSTNVYSLPINPSWAAGVYTISIANESSKKNNQFKTGNQQVNYCHLNREAPRVI